MLHHDKEDKGEAGKQHAHCGQNEYVSVYTLMAQVSQSSQPIPDIRTIWQSWAPTL